MTSEPLYRVIVNDDEQMSLWPLHKDDPHGWRGTQVRGTRAECLAQVRETWSDVRPARLRG
jgi:MbtH protein